MKAAIITFIGGVEAGNIGSTTWGNAATGTIDFPLRQPVLIDPETASGERRKFLEHVITKARTNRFFTVSDDVDDADAKAAVVKDPVPQKRTKPNPKRGKKGAVGEGTDETQPV